MSRTTRPDSGQLPAIKAPYEAEVVRFSPRELVPIPVHPVHPVNRIEYLEEKLAVQEKTTTALLEKAHKIKEDLIENLNFTHGTWQNEKHARELLQEHIRSITDVVRRLSNDIVALEQSIQHRKTERQGTSTAMKNFEIQYAAGLTDLRGRVARCDASLAKLAADLKQCSDSLGQFNHQGINSNTKLSEKVFSLEQRVGQLGNEIDKNSTEQTRHVKHVEEGYSITMQNLDSKNRSLAEETRALVNSHKAAEEHLRARLENKLTNHVDQSLKEMESKRDKFERRMEDSLQTLTKKVGKLQDELSKERDRNAAAIQAMEAKLDSALQNQLRRQKDEMDKFKREYRQGFATIHDSITNMKQVMDGKRQLLEEQLRKEIGQIRKLVVLI